MLKKLVILGAVTAGATLALPNPAQAILYNVTGSLGGSVAVNGTLDFNGSTYTGWSLAISGFGNPNTNLNQTFDSSQGSNFTNQFSGGNSLLGNGDSNPTSSILSVALPGSDFTSANGTSGYYLVLVFNPPLSGVSTNLTPGDADLEGSYSSLKWLVKA